MVCQRLDISKYDEPTSDAFSHELYRSRHRYISYAEYVCRFTANYPAFFRDAELCAASLGK